MVCSNIMCTFKRDLTFDAHLNTLNECQSCFSDFIRSLNAGCSSPGCAHMKKPSSADGRSGGFAPKPPVIANL